MNEDGMRADGGTPVANPEPARWREANAAWLAASLRLLRLRLHRHALDLRKDDATTVGDWLVAGDVGERRAAPGQNGATDALSARISAEARALDERTTALEAAEARPALKVLAEVAGLTPLEEQVLLLAAAPSLDGAFGPAYAELHRDSRRDHASLHLALSLFVTPDERLVAADCLLPHRALRHLRLVDTWPDPGGPALLRPLTADDRVSDYLRGINRLDERLEPYLLPLAVAAPTDGSKRLAAAIVGRARAEPMRWPTLNLVGPADRGGRDAVGQACAELGLRGRQLDANRLTSIDHERRDDILALLGREATLADLAFLVDATGVERGSPTAGVVDELVRSIQAPLFLISAEGWLAGDTVLDVLSMQPPTRTEQRTMWWTALEPYPHSVNGEIDAIVQQFDFGPATIGQVVARAARDATEAITGRDLWDACRAQSGPGLDDLARRIIPAWDWDDIVVSEDVRGQLRELASQVEHRSRVYETWGFGAQLGRGRGITALFAGPTGTGKTMAAQIIAGDLNLDLYRIDLAGVVSKYVGETEKNLKRVFDAAEKVGAILLFDEADALFGTRTEVRDSHDRYANLEINYLLQRMEDYAGLAILATNRRSALDGAFLRRLRFIIDFPFPDPEDRRQIWERVFPAAAELDVLDHGFLSRLELSGGNIRSIAINAAFLAAGDGAAIGMTHVVRAAAREYGKLARPISAGDFGEWLTVARP